MQILVESLEEERKWNGSDADMINLKALETKFGVGFD